MDIPLLKSCIAGFLLAGIVLFPFGSHGQSLDACIHEALEVNPTTRAAEKRVEAARALMRQARSAYFPRLTASADWAQTDNPPQAFMMELNQRTLDMQDPAFDPNNPGDTQNTRLSVGVKYRLFDGMKRPARVAMARFGSEAAAEQFEAARNNLIYEVTRGYYSVLQAQAFVRVREESVASLEESLRVARERFRAGSAVKTDVLNLEVKLAQAKEDLISARNGVQLAVVSLNTTIGHDMIAETGLEQTEDDMESHPPPALEMACVGGRPELRAVQKMVKMKQEAYRKATRAYIPVVNAFGSYDWDSEQLDDLEDSYMVGVAAEWELFTGFDRPAQIAKARAEWEEAQQMEERARNELRLDLKQAHLKAGDAWERWGVARKSLESAEEALRITRAQYEQGAADLPTLLTAEVGLMASRTRSVAARYDYIIQLSNIQRARGILAREYGQSM